MDMISSTEATELAQQLAERGSRLVLAESCTAGLVSALLAAVPGISDYLCGSLVAYRAECKRGWLGIDPDVIEQHSAVSSTVSRQLATAVLQRTPIADYSAAVTGHLGPDAPPALDGRIYIAVARRHHGRLELHDEVDFQLVATERTSRQLEAARLVLRTLIKTVSADSSTQEDRT